MGRSGVRVANLWLAGVCAAAAGMMGGQAARADAVFMTANDALGSSSLNSAGNWNNAAAPSAGNTYTNVDAGGLGHLLRTPGSAGGFTFAGDSLTIGSNLATDLNQSLIFKGAGGSAGSPNTITVNNLIMNSGYIRQGSGSGDFFALAGHLQINGGGFNIQGPTFINSVITGSTATFLDSPGSTEVARTLHFTNAANTYTGSLELRGGSPNFSRFELDATGVYNFAIGANGASNQIFGPGIATYDGAFNFNLTGADNAVGDVWNVAAAAGGQTFTGTFSVLGFNNAGGGLWTKVANGVTYQFNQGTGNLSTAAIPEPVSLAVLGLGMVGVVWKRKKRVG